MNIQAESERSQVRRHAWASIAVLVAVCVAAGCSPEKRRVGEAFDIGSVSYQIKGKQLRSQIILGDSTIESGRRASFVIINYVVSNHGKDYISVNPMNLLLVTLDQTEYQVDVPATYALKMKNAFESSSADSSAMLAAGSSGSYSAVFRVPDDVAHQKLSVVIRRYAVVDID